MKVNASKVVRVIVWSIIIELALLAGYILYLRYFSPLGEFL